MNSSIPLALFPFTFFLGWIFLFDNNLGRRRFLVSNKHRFGMQFRLVSEHFWLGQKYLITHWTRRLCREVHVFNVGPEMRLACHGLAAKAAEVSCIPVLIAYIQRFLFFQLDCNGRGDFQNEKGSVEVMYME